MFCFYDTTTKHIRLIRDVTWLDKNHGTWKGLKTNNIKLEEDYFDDPSEFGRDGKDDDFFNSTKFPTNYLLKKSLSFALHYVNFKRFIIIHQQWLAPPYPLRELGYLRYYW